jgi:dTDP-4-dehydrorhamnose reductase
MYLIIGSGGQLSSELENLLTKEEYISLTKEELNITSKEDVLEKIKEINPNYIINCAAYTNVDKAEKDSNICKQVNVDGVENIAVASNEVNATLIHISTDYVFDGTKYTPYKESDETNPKSVYGKTKLDGEHKALSIAHTCAVLRTSWLYSNYGNNFIKTITRLAKERDELGIIYDQIGSPTYAKDLARTIINICPKVEKNTHQVFHFSNEGVASWYDFAIEIAKLQNIECNIKPIETKDYPTTAPRPHYSVLSKSKIKNKFNIEIKHWKEALEECLENQS